MTAVANGFLVPISRWASGVFGTVFVGAAFLFIGLATSGPSSANIPGQQGLVLMSATAGFMAVGSALCFRDQMTKSHVVMGATLMVYAAVRGWSLTYQSLTDPSAPYAADGVYDLILDTTPPWAWQLVFAVGFTMWGTAYVRLRAEREQGAKPVGKT